jgi:hypothetical protein
MFVGHYGVGFAAKRAEPTIPLGVLFLSPVSGHSLQDRGARVKTG